MPSRLVTCTTAVRYPKSPISYLHQTDTACLAPPLQMHEFKQQRGSVPHEVAFRANIWKGPHQSVEVNSLPYGLVATRVSLRVDSSYAQIMSFCAQHGETSEATSLNNLGGKQLRHTGIDSVH